jgi:hypothetical protein
MSSKEELIITAMQQRIAELVADYELKISILRADLTIMADAQNEREKAIDQYSKDIESKIAGE